MTVEEWKQLQKKRHVACYAHFDRKISLDQCWEEISDPEKVRTHSFYPFIHYTSKSRRVKDGVRRDPKEREIFYAAHKDGWIYRLYAFKLNEKYNERAFADGIDSVAVAYRNNHPGRNNIDDAYDAIQFIKKCGQCHIMVGDFTHFFDTLSHPYLKERMCDLLGCAQLPPDWYAVFKNVTRFSSVELTDLLKFHGIENTAKGREQLNKMKVVLNTEQFHGFRSKIGNKDKRIERRGVPQGSPISAVLANVYMLQADKRLAEYAAALNGLYMRYSDDFIMVIPNSTTEEFGRHYAVVQNVISAAGGIKLKPEKTKTFSYADQRIRNCEAEMFPNKEKGKDVLEFLGFAFDGNKIRLRDKTISRYYNKAYRKARTLVRNHWTTSKGTRASAKNLRRLYTIKGSQFYRRNHGETFDEFGKYKERNFLDYIYAARKKMGSDFVDTITPRHMQRISKVLYPKKL